MSDIFREVDEALQKEKAAAFWKNYGPTLVLAAILMVASTGITTAYLAWKSSSHQNDTAKLVAAAEQKDIAAAMEQAGQEMDGGHKAVALMNAAAKFAEKKDFAKASANYEAVANDKSAPQDIRDLANIFYTRAAILAAGDTAPDYKALADRLSPIAKNTKSAFRAQAQLEAATLYGNGLKDYTGALELLKGFDTESAADSLKEKADALKHVYSYELSKAQQQPAAQD